jgi:tagaturonate epimerase
VSHPLDKTASDHAPSSAWQFFPESLHLQPQSWVIGEQAAYALAEVGGRQSLAVVAPAGSHSFHGLTGDLSSYRGRTLCVGPLSSENAAYLRSRLPWLKPQALGLRTSVGLGDRLGLATPAHVRTLRFVGGDLAPIFAQQSIREMQRTSRSPQQIVDDAMWGVFAQGWSTGFGADADHLKAVDDIEACVRAGYTLFTFDPGDLVWHESERFDTSQLKAAFESLPWDRLQDRPEAVAKRYSGRVFHAEEWSIQFDDHTLLRAAVKYGRAIAHAAEMYGHLVRAATGRSFEVEISVDETLTPTSHPEHIFLALELQRLGVSWVSLAPRYVGDFEKGVDYVGDLDAFQSDFSVHAAISRCFGPYKLSIHSGSDKYAIYQSVALLTRGLVHLKTAGTSYLEALFTISSLDPELFREIYTFALRHFENARASYHISADLRRAPTAAIPNDKLPSLLANRDARQILHVTYGAVLNDSGDGEGRALSDRLRTLLSAGWEAYGANLQAHLGAQLLPFSAATKGWPPKP